MPTIDMVVHILAFGSVLFLILSLLLAAKEYIENLKLNKKE